MIRVEFTAAAALLCACALFTLLLLTAALARGSAARRRATGDRVLPEIRDRLVDYLSGNNDLARLSELAATHRRTVADAILEFQGKAGGSALDRLSEAALELTLVHDWCLDARSRDAAVRRAAYERLAFVSAFEPCRRVTGDVLIGGLRDADAAVRLSAARGIARSGDPDQIEYAFEMAVTGDLLVRVALAGDLRRHALALAESAIPKALGCDDPECIRATLDLLLAWERALPVRDVRGLIEHADAGIRLRALRLVPRLVLSPEDRAAVVRMLTQGDSETRAAAAEAAGRLKIAEALPGLAVLVRCGDAETARIAAAALAQLPPRGWDTLKELSGGANAESAGVARQALDRARREVA